jgi:hypothetical protein
MSISVESYGITYGVQSKRPLKRAAKLLVRMGRLELPRPLQALEPKSSASANSATSARGQKLLQRSIWRQPPARAGSAALVFRKLRNSRGFLVSCGNVAIVF